MLHYVAINPLVKKRRSACAWRPLGIYPNSISHVTAGRSAVQSKTRGRNKISRGSFTAAFFMMCMDVIGVRQVSLEV
jgi:hypothetical protein